MEHKSLRKNKIGQTKVFWFFNNHNANIYQTSFEKNSGQYQLRTNHLKLSRRRDATSVDQAISDQASS